MKGMNYMVNYWGAELMVVAGIAITAIVAVYSGMQDRDPNPTEHYCDMVEIHMQSSGEYGWPDSKDLYQYCGENK